MTAAPMHTADARGIRASTLSRREQRVESVQLIRRHGSGLDLTPTGLTPCRYGRTEADKGEPGWNRNLADTT